MLGELAAPVIDFPSDPAEPLPATQPLPSQ